MANPGASLEELVRSEDFEARAAQTDEDADEAESVHETLLASSEVKGLGSAAVAQYKADNARLNKARNAFDDEFNKATSGKSSTDKLLGTYERYLIALSALEAQNDRFQALADARIATLAKAVAALMLGVLANARKKVVELEAELKKLAAALKKAEKDVEGAKLQRTINACISAAALLAGPAGVLARVLVAGGSITAQLTVDYALGSSKGSAGNASVTVLGGAADGIDKLGTVGKKFVSAAASVVSFKLDSDEIGEAEAVFAAARQQLEKTLERYDEVMGIVVPLGKKARSLQAGLLKATAAAEDAQARGAEAREDYAEMRSLLQP